MSNPLTPQEIVKQRLDRLFKDGVLMQIHTAKWSMTASLSKEDLDIEAEVPTIFSLGKKWLIDKDILSKFTTIDGAARSFLHSNSVRFPIAQAYFVPVNRVVFVSDGLEKYKVKYQQATEDFIQNYEKYKTEMLEKYPDLRASLEPHYPNANSLIARFGFFVSRFEIAMPKKFREVTVAELQARTEAEKVLQLKYESQLEDQYRRSTEEMEKFISNTVAELRAPIIETFQILIDKISSGEVVSARNINTIKTIIDNFSNLNFIGDKTVQSRLDELKKLVNSSSDFKLNQAALASLSASMNNVIEVAKNMSDVDALTGDYFRSLQL